VPMISPTGRRSFTLIEVLVCVVILSSGIIFIFQSFFTCLDAYDRYLTYYNIMPWANEQLWLAQNEINRGIAPGSYDKEGEFSYEGKAFFWHLSSRLVDKKEILCRLDLTISWQRARKAMTMKRYAYAYHAALK